MSEKPEDESHSSRIGPTAVIEAQTGHLSPKRLFTGYVRAWDPTGVRKWISIPQTRVSARIRTRRQHPSPFEEKRLEWEKITIKMPSNLATPHHNRSECLQGFFFTDLMTRYGL